MVNSKNKKNDLREKIRIRLKNMSRLDKRRLARETTDPDILAELAEDEDREVRRLVANNNHTDGNTLEKLRENDSSIVVQTAALKTIKTKFVSTMYQQREFEKKLAYAIYEDEQIIRRVKKETLQFLYENDKRINKEDFNELNRTLQPFYEQKPELSEYMKALQEGIILGSMLEGAHEHSVDLMVANLTGKDVDKANIDSNTKEEVAAKSEHNAQMKDDIQIERV